MSQNFLITTPEAERAELESVIEALARWPRLASLMRYMGEKYFSGEVEQLHEYAIATEVLGRSKMVFDPGEDAIVRVEAHRLRKRLREFYETEGRDHLLQVTLPSGRYVPHFVPRSSASSLSVVPSEAEVGCAIPPPAELVEISVPTSAASSEEKIPQKSGTSSIGRPKSGIFKIARERTVFLSFGVLLILVALVCYLFFRSGAFSKPIQATASNPQGNTPVAPGGVSPFVPLRILAGYNGNPRIDSAGVTWNPDQYYIGGGSWRRNSAPIARTSDPFIFDQWRNGDFVYRIPLKPGIYELHLFFVTALRSSDAISTFSVSVNGEPVLRGFDINWDALGDGIADERIFRDVSPSKDGFLTIGFTGEQGPPSLNAIEILPGLPHRQNPIRLITQTSPFTDRRGQVWHPDNYFMNGRLSGQTRVLDGASDPELFAEERYGHFTYALPVDTRDKYTLILHFAEFYFGPGASGSGGPGSRLFRVMCNGQILLDNFDIYKEAGSFREVAKTFHHIKPNAQGKLNLTFEPIINNATISGIEVLDEGP